MFSSLQTAFTDLMSHLKVGQRWTEVPPPGSGDAYYLSQWARTSPQTCVVFCADPLQAQRLAHEIALFTPELNTLLLPDWETLPYDRFSPHQDLVSERLKSLHALSMKQVHVLTVPVSTVLNPLPPASFLSAYTFSFKQGQTLDLESFKLQLIRANYEHVPQVTHPGQFSLRGSIIDLFPMGSPQPYRIDLFDNEIDSLRAFDVDTQRSLSAVESIDLLPGREFPMDEAARTHFRTRFRELFEGDPTKAIPYNDVGHGIPFAGIEYYLPLFFEKTATLFDYLPSDTLTLTYGDIDKAMARFHHEAQSRYQFLKSDQERPILSPDQLFLSQDDFYLNLKQFARLDWKTTQDEHPLIKKAPDVAVLHRSQAPFSKLLALTQQADQHIVLCAESAGRRETLVQVLQENGIQVPVSSPSVDQLDTLNDPFSITIAPLTYGFSLPAEGLVVLTENDLYPESAARFIKRSKKTRQTNVDAIVRDLSELHEGDPIVHIQHGVGRYQGLVTMQLSEGEVEMLKLVYANDTDLYVPISQLHVISRYGGADPDNAPLHTLGSGQWDKARKKAAKKIRDTAAELLNLYAHRAAREGFTFKLPLSDYTQFSEQFGFEETPDQQAAIEAVIEDMTRGQPMDRLVCGDVGFGKTEVALRAAFVCIANGLQVALLCPTTLLAEQHAKTFRDRFADWPVKVAELSRFRSAKESHATLQGLADGTIDIVVGTHKLLSKDTQFKRLGLVIIDEEHRFGVRQKEALKALRSEVDILTLTATPIPRTLGMSLDGIRDFSVIATAPEKRLAIKTFVRREDNSTLNEAVLRELKRGGQVYFLHNEVDTIYTRKAQLEELFPEARIAVAHGQMPERELEQVMKGFYQQRFNILLCTTIVETGIDVPTANTIIIHRADRLGLAQLHQLRGRVGRSHHQAYAYLLIPSEEGITSNARKRLEAIQAMEELGSGFFLAMHDLEIRGSGEILGETQSGNMHEIGFSLYTDMLNQAIRALKEGKEPNYESPFEQSCEIKVHQSALLPSDYCPDINLRLGFYKRLSHANTLADVIDIQEELIDRLGPLPDPAKLFIQTHKLRLQATPLGIINVDIGEDLALIQFTPTAPVDPLSLLEMVQKNRHIHFSGPEKIKIEFQASNIEARFQTIGKLITQLTRDTYTTDTP